MKLDNLISLKKQTNEINTKSCNILRNIAKLLSEMYVWMVVAPLCMYVCYVIFLCPSRRKTKTKRNPLITLIHARFSFYACDQTVCVRNWHVEKGETGNVSMCDDGNQNR